MNVRQIRTDPHFESIGQAAAGVVAKVAEAKDTYSFWRRGLEIGNGRQLTREQAKSLGATTEPQSGYFRRRNKEDRDTAVAIWSSEQGVFALADGRTVHPDTIWTQCFAWPISYELYEAVIERDEPWPEQGPARGIGDNLPEDPHEAAKVQFEGEKEYALEILKNPIKTQADADKAAVVTKTLTELHGTVDKLFRAKKDPNVVEGRRIDEEFRWREDVKALSTKVKAHQEAFLKEQKRLEEARQRKAREEAAAAEMAAAEAARKAAKLEGQGGQLEEKARVEADRLAAEAVTKERDTQERKVYAGRTGAKTKLVKFYTAKITDYGKLVVALKDTDEVRKAVEGVAASIARGKGPVPDGMERVEDERVV